MSSPESQDLEPGEVPKELVAKYTSFMNAARPSGKVCLVCGDTALSCNFGAITCESCKAFFRRNALKEMWGKCDGTCPITTETRSYCKKCRLAKCFSVGMRKDLILNDQQKMERRQKIMENRLRRKHSTSLDGNPMHMGVQGYPPYSHPSASTTNELSMPSSCHSLSPQIYDKPGVSGYSDYIDQGAAEVMSDEPMSRPPSHTSRPPDHWSLSTAQHTDLPTPKGEIVDLSHDESVITPHKMIKVETPLPSMTPPMPSLQEGALDLHLPKVHREQFIDPERLRPQDLTKNSVLHSTAVESQQKHSQFAQNKPGYENSVKEKTSSLSAPIKTDISEMSPQDSGISTSSSIPPNSMQSSPDISNDHHQVSCENLKIEHPIQQPIEESLDMCGSAHLQEKLDSLETFDDFSGFDKELLLEAHVAVYETFEIINSQNMSEKPSFVDFFNLADGPIRKLVRMSKCLHKFRTLSQDDQISLLKGSVLQVVIIRSAKRFDPRSLSWNVPKGVRDMNVSGSSLLASNPDGQKLFMQYIQYVTKLLKSSQGDSNILTLLMVLSLFTVHSDNVKGADLVNLINNEYCCLLKTYTMKRFPENLDMYKEVMSCHRDIKSLIELHSKALKQTPATELQPLIMEIFDVAK